MPTWNVTHKDGDQGRYEGMTSHKLLRSDFIVEAKQDDGGLTNSPKEGHWLLLTQRH